MRRPMSSDTRQPSWWQLYLLMLLAVVLFVAESGLSASRTVHQLLQACIVLAVFVLVQGWLSANRHELMEAERRQTHQLDRHTAFPPRKLITDRTEAETPEAPMFHLPPAGLRNTLGDTFELEAPETDAANRASK
jgi:hypothetical protein